MTLFKFECFCWKTQRFNIFTFKKKSHILITQLSALFLWAESILLPNPNLLPVTVQLNKHRFSSGAGIVMSAWHGIGLSVKIWLIFQHHAFKTITSTEFSSLLLCLIFGVNARSGVATFIPKHVKRKINGKHCSKVYSIGEIFLKEPLDLWLVFSLYFSEKW